MNAAEALVQALVKELPVIVTEVVQIALGRTDIRVDQVTVPALIVFAAVLNLGVNIVTHAVSLRFWIIRISSSDKDPSLL